jgi:hypothetical protein
VPRGPFGVVVTNSGRTGTTYAVLLVDVNGRVVAQAAGNLPLIKSNQSVDLPLVSASSTKVYYRSGDTDIYSLAPDGTTARVRTIPDGASAELAFAVKPDDQRIAVVAINEAVDATKDTGHGYVEDLSGATNHVDLFRNTSNDAFRWPVGWHGDSIVDAAGNCGGNYGYNGPQAGGVARPCSYHVVDAASGSRRAIVCETPATQPGGGDYYSLQGGPTAVGTACEENQGDYNNGGHTDAMMSVDWSGSEHAYLSLNSTVCCSASIPLTGCLLSVDASRMACVGSSNAAVTLLNKNGSTHDLGRRYALLGWIDAGHLLVGVDTNTLGVLQPDTGTLTTLALASADKTIFGANLPGDL